MDDAKSSRPWALLKRRLGTYALLVAAALTVGLAISLGWTLAEEARDQESQALTLARTVVDERIVSLRWAAGQRPIYLAEGDGPSAALRRLSPEQLITELFRLGATPGGVVGRATSLTPLGPANQPDPWERGALEAFGRGATERFERRAADGGEVLRYARALRVEEACLRCHAAQGQALGDLRGALSVSVPLQPAVDGLSHEQRLAGFHLVLWLLGLGAVALGWSRFRRRLGQQERTEARLRAARERLELAAQGGGVGFWDWDFTTGRIDHDAQSHRLLGLPPGTLRHASEIGELLHPDERPSVQAEVLRLRTGEVPELDIEHRVRTADGGWRWMHSRGAVVERDGAGQATRAVGVWVDVSSRREASDLQRRLELSDRLSSLGTLAAGVAHELNGPLATIRANLDHALSQLGPEAPADAARQDALEAVTDARDEARRAGAIVRSMQAFSRPDDQARALSPAAAVEAAAALARPAVRERGRLVVEPGDAPPVLGSHDRLVQVLLNLLVNAAQALPARGGPGAEVRVRVLAGPGESVIEVADTGCGIPAAVLPRIFDPFFTTKPPGQGTGLGLSISQGIVAGMGGRLEVTSVVGEGTTMRVVLPALHPDLVAALPAAPLSRPSRLA